MGDGGGDAVATGGAAQVGALRVNAPSKRVSLRIQGGKPKEKRARADSVLKAAKKKPSGAARQVATRGRISIAGGGEVHDPAHEARATRNLVREEDRRRSELHRQRRNQTRLAASVIASTAVTYGAGRTLAGGKVGARQWDPEKGRFERTSWKPQGHHVQLKINHNRVMGAPRKKGDARSPVSFRFTSETPPGRKIYWHHPHLGVVMGDEKTTWVIPAPGVQNAARRAVVTGAKSIIHKDGNVELVIKHPGHDDQSIHGYRPDTSRSRRRSRRPVGAKAVGRTAAGTAHYDSLGRFTAPDDPGGRRKRQAAALTAAVLIGAAAAPKSPVRRRLSDELTVRQGRKAVEFHLGESGTGMPAGSSTKPSTSGGSVKMKVRSGAKEVKAFGVRGAKRRWSAGL